MKNKNISFKAKFAGLIAGAFMLGTAGAQATMLDGIVDQWSADLSGQFICNLTQFNGSGGSCSANTMSWGASTGSGRSGLDLINSSGPSVLNTNGAAIPNLSVTHRNRIISIGSSTLDSAVLRSSLTLTAVSPAGPAAGLPPSVDFKINFFETPNEPSQCADGRANGVGLNGNGCSDIFVLSQDILNIPFFYDLDGSGALQNQQYFLSFFELTGGLNPLSNAACSAAGAANGCIGFQTAEGVDTTFQFAAKITTERLTVNVPEPATLILFGIGMLGLGVVARRRV